MVPTASPILPPPVLAEVVARFGDRVVDVQHVGTEPEPRVASAGWYTLGACAMVLGLGLVAISLPDPPRPELAAAPEAQPPAPPSFGAAGLGALLVLLGVVPLVIAARSRSVPRDRYMIGEGPGVHLPVVLPAGATQAGVPLVRALERQIVLGLVPGMTGELHDGERTISVAELVAQGRNSYALPDGARGELALGALRFTIQAVDRAAFAPERGHVDRLYLVSNVGALALLGGLLLLGEPPSGPLELEETAARRALAVSYLTDVPPPPPPPPAVAPPVPQDRSPRAAAKPAAAPPSAPPTIPELAVEVSGPAKSMPKGMRRGIRNDYSYARVTGALGDGEFLDSIDRNTANSQEGLLGYDNEADRAMWVAVANAPVINRPFGGLELAETERGGGLHGDRPKPAKAPGKDITIDMYAPRTPPSAAAIKAARRVVSIALETPNVVGEMDPMTVQDHLRKQADGLKRCFRDTVDDTERVGHVLLMLKVNGDGKVDKATLKWGATQLGPIGPCLTKVAGAWKFPATLDRKPASIVVEAVYSAKDF